MDDEPEPDRVWVLTLTDETGTSVFRVYTDPKDGIREAEQVGTKPLRWTEHCTAEGETRRYEAFDAQEQRWRIEAFEVAPPGVPVITYSVEEVEALRRQLGSDAPDAH